MEHQELVLVNGRMSNRGFFESYARSGCVGLVGGTTWIDKAIVGAQRGLDERRRLSRWSHAFLITERRLDGHWWTLESDLEIHRKHIRLGAQENRLAKYWDPELHSTLAILDFHLPPDRVREIVAGGLDLVAGHAKYSLREILGTLIALRHPSLRGRENLMARDRSFYCSAFVQHLFRKAGVDLAPGIPDKQTTPEDLSRTPVPHTLYILEREAARSRVADVARRLKARVRLRLRSRREKT
ncbi:MAG: hypothetical protein HYR88_05455 [Verrucomicrobia bacterium]|nr:hypothetical protein [Verrucomicrobiota bacterium]